MAKIEVLAPFVLSWEGGYCNVPGDHGGATNKGVTIATWRMYGYDKDCDGDIDERDLRLVTEYDAIYVIMKPIFWDRWKADDIVDQSVANLLVDWLWTSGKYGIRIPQYKLGLKQDGNVGPKTLAAINEYPDKKELFDMLWRARNDYFKRLGEKKTQKKFLAGWLNRNASIQYGRLVCNGGNVIQF